MNLTYAIVTAALLALSGVIALGIRRHQQISRAGNLVQQLVPLDVEAFRNLTDPAEEEYLRAHLQGRAYRKVRRARLRAIAAYVHLASRNAALLAQIGQAATSHPDPQRAEAARSMSDDAFRLRRNATVALARIYAAMVWPGLGSPLTPFQDQYLRVVGSAMLFGRLQDPAQASRFAVAEP